MKAPVCADNHKAFNMLPSNMSMLTRKQIQKDSSRLLH